MLDDAIERGGYEPDDPTLEMYELDDGLSEFDRLYSVILDSVCFAIQHGYWHFAFYQARGWWNIFDALRVMYRHNPTSIDELLAGMQEGYRKYVLEYSHARDEVELLWQAFTEREICERCKKAQGEAN